MGIKLNDHANANVHRCGVLSAGSRAGQYKYVDIEVAVPHLQGMLDSAR